MPLAAALAMALTAFALNMSYGYFVESRGKRELANLFGAYVPPEHDGPRDGQGRRQLQHEGHEQGAHRDVLRHAGLHHVGTMEPTRLQELLNFVFSRLTDPDSRQQGHHRQVHGRLRHGFWGAPVDIPNHAHMAVKTAMEMAGAVRQINEEQQAKGSRDRHRHRLEHRRHVRGRHGLGRPARLHRDR